MMNEPEVKAAQEKYGLTYHISYAADAQRLVDFVGKDVLEVGGSMPEGFCFGELGVARWTCVDEPSYWHEIQGARGGDSGAAHLTYAELTEVEDVDQLDRYAVLNGRVEDLPESMFGKYDVIFSVAAFEHIANLGHALDRMFQALKPGGQLFSAFAPIWPAPDGHHLPEIFDAAGRKFSDAARLIPSWGHLTMRPPEMYEWMRAHTDDATAAKIVYYVYHSPHINRLFVEDYLTYANQSPFKIRHFTLAFPIITPGGGDLEGALSALRASYPGRQHFSHAGILMVLTKPEDAV